MTKAFRTLQIGQLSALTMMHSCVDMFGGMLPALLPVIREEFSLSLRNGAWLLGLAGLACNSVQVFTGHLRPYKSRPLLMPIGLLAASSICFLVFLTGINSPKVWVWALVLIGGLGVGVAHPEGFRGIYSLRMIPVTLATAIFINGGFLCVGAGAWLGTLAVAAWGLKGLLVFLAVPMVCVTLVYLLKIRLAVDRKPTTACEPQSDELLPFLPIVLMAAPYAITATILLSLLPTLLVEEMHFNIEFGGFSMMVMVTGSVLGSLFWAAWARTRGELWCCTWALLAGIPLLLAYLMLLEHKWALWVLGAATGCALAVFPLMVTLARHARGVNLGGRMGVVVGGAWGIGSLALIALGPVAERYSVRAVMNFSWAPLLIAAACGILLMRRSKAPHV